MIFAWFRDWRHVGAVPDCGIRSRSKEKVEEAQQHHAELRASSFQEEVVYMIWSKRFICVQVSDYPFQFIPLDATSLEVSRRVAQCIMVEVIMRGENGCYASVYSFMVSNVCLIENGLGRINKNVMDHRGFCRVIRDWLAWIRRVRKCRNGARVPELFRVVQPVELLHADLSRQRVAVEPGVHAALGSADQHAFPVSGSFPSTISDDVIGLP